MLQNNPGDRSQPRGAGSLRDDRWIAVAVFFLALAVYLFTYDGTFSSNNDERALFSGTDSLIRLGSFSINPMYWDYTNVGMMTARGDMVPNYEPGQMLLVTPFYLWGRALDASIQGAMLFSVFVSAAAVALIYLCVIELGYRRRTALLTTAVFAFATLTWPYSRTLFREPLTVLTYLLAVYAVLCYRPPAPRKIGWALLAGFSLGVALANKEISVAVLPPIFFLILAYEWRRRRLARAGEPLPPDSWGKRIRDGLAFIVPLAVLWLASREYTQYMLSDAVEWSRDIVKFTTNPQISSSLAWRMWLGGSGLTISFYRGLFWFSPVLMLALVGFFMMLRRRPAEALTFLAAFGIHLLGYSRYLYWSGGLAWGPRYMLPVVPFLALLCAPVFAWLLRERHVEDPDAPPAPTSVWRVLGSAAVVLLIAASVFVQIPGLAVDVRAWENQHWAEVLKNYGDNMGVAVDSTYMSPDSSPILGHLRVLFSGREPLDFAWVRLLPEAGSEIVPLGLGLSLLGVVLAAVAFVAIWRKPERARRLWPFMLGGSIVLASALLLTYRHADARFDPYGVDRFLAPMIADLEQTAGENAGCCRSGLLQPASSAQALIVPDPTLTDYFLNRFTAPMPWYDIAASPMQEDEMARLLNRHTDIWVARDRSAQADDQEGRRDLERYLTAHAYKVEEKTYGDWARLLHYSSRAANAEQAAPGQTLGDMSLDKVTLRVAPGPAGAPCPADGPLPDQPLDDGRVVAASGDTLQVGLEWRALSAPAGNYTVFLQLLDESGQVRGQKDRWPGDGLYPTAALATGQVISDGPRCRSTCPPASTG